MRKHGNNRYFQPIVDWINWNGLSLSPWLSIKQLTQKARSSRLVLFVSCLPACFFDSPAPLYLFVSARPPPTPTPPTTSSALLKKTLHFISLGSLTSATRTWPGPGPNRRYSLSSLLGMCCAWPSSVVVLWFFFLSHNCACLNTLNSSSNSGAHVKTCVIVFHVDF